MCLKKPGEHLKSGTDSQLFMSVSYASTHRKPLILKNKLKCNKCQVLYIRNVKNKIKF